MILSRSILNRPDAPRLPRRRRRKPGFFKDERGVTAIEFGILAVPFFVIIAAILQTSLVFLASQILDSAVQDAARMIRTGQAQLQDPPVDADQFRQEICDGLYGMFNCDNLQISVTTVKDFASASIGSPINTTDPTAPWTLKQQYCPGVGKSVVMVQAYYKWPVPIHFAGFNLQSSPDGTHLMGAVRVFMNEPFGGANPTC